MFLKPNIAFRKGLWKDLCVEHDLCACACCAEPNLLTPFSLTGSKAAFEKVFVYSADIRKGAPTASELAEQVTWTVEHGGEMKLLRYAPILLKGRSETPPRDNWSYTK